MAWIESHQALLTHRKTLRVVDRLKIKRVLVIGHMHILWWWALDNLPDDGDLGDLTDTEIARAADWTGKATDFTEALTSAGFIDATNGHRNLHDWWDYAGRLNAKRSADAARKRGSRAEVAATSTGHPLDIHRMSARTNRPTDQQTQPTDTTDQPQDLGAAFVPKLTGTDDEQPDPDFAEHYRRGYETTTGKPVPGGSMVSATKVETRFGLAACLKVAPLLGWDKSPNYYIHALEELENGIEPRRATGAGTAYEAPRQSTADIRSALGIPDTTLDDEPDPGHAARWEAAQREREGHEAETTLGRPGLQSENGRTSGA